MIVLVHVLERGNDYLFFSCKGAELQETTVCHAEENAHINDVVEDLFDSGARPEKSCSLDYEFSLEPIRQIQFSLYDDNKYSLTGMIEAPDFADLVKHYFTRIYAYKL